MKIFLDCGSNLGQGFEHFRNIYGDEYSYHLFEANPNCTKILFEKYNDLKNVTIINKAVSNKNGEMFFYFQHIDPLSLGGSLLTEHNSKYYNSSDENDVEKIKVEVIDITAYINTWCSFIQDCQIILKLDVESSEYDILESLIQTKTIHKIKKMYIEFHTEYMVDGEIKNILLKRENQILEYLKNNDIDYVLENDTGKWI